VEIIFSYAINAIENVVKWVLLDEIKAGKVNVCIYHTGYIIV